MKTIKRLVTIAFMLCLLIGTVNAQSRYKHVPRVKVNVKKADKTFVNQELSANTTTAELIKSEESVEIASNDVVNEEVLTASSSNETIEIAKEKTKSPIQHRKAKTKAKKKKFNFDAMADQLMSSMTFGAVKGVSKTHMAKWVLWMIVCFAAALVFFIGGFVGISFFGGPAVGGGALSYVFWVLAGIAFLGGFVFLILGLTGVMS